MIRRLNWGRNGKWTNKHVPAVCYAGTDGEKYYQYTMLEEAGRKRFIYAYQESSSYSIEDFIRRSIVYFGYVPDIMQTDNRTEVTYAQRPA